MIQAIQSGSISFSSHQQSYPIKKVVQAIEKLGFRIGNPTRGSHMPILDSEGNSITSYSVNIKEVPLNEIKRIFGQLKKVNLTIKEAQTLMGNLLA